MTIAGALVLAALCVLWVAACLNGLDHGIKPHNVAGGDPDASKAAARATPAASRLVDLIHRTDAVPPGDDPSPAAPATTTQT